MSRLLGIDVGSTTVKVTVIDPKTNEILYKSYERHFSKVKECVLGELKKVAALFPDGRFRAAVTGSAGLGLAEKSSISFVQEVQAAFIAIRRFYPDADAAVELGGEDAKIIFLTGGTEQRMNGSCAGGTGAFIDQMATLLNISVSEMDELALHAEKNLSHCVPVRSIRKVGHSAAAQSGRGKIGYFRFHLSGRGGPDCGGIGAGATD